MSANKVNLKLDTGIRKLVSRTFFLQRSKKYIHQYRLHTAFVPRVYASKKFSIIFYLIIKISDKD